MRLYLSCVLIAGTALTACIGGKGSGSNSPPPNPNVNTLAVSVDSGPAATGGAINRPYVTVKICSPGTTTCATVDHVLLDTGSWGLRIDRSVLVAASVTLTAETDTQGQTIEECAAFGGGQTWGPVAAADVSMAGELAQKVPIQIIEDTSAGTSPALPCTTGGAPGALVTFNANGVLGVGVFAQDCGLACTNASAPLPQYFGCPSSGACVAENVPLTSQVTNPVTMFAGDNNGVIVNLPKLQNANGDSSVQGQVIFGIGTQSDNALPAVGITVLGADTSGDFTATYNGNTTVLPALIDSGGDDYGFADPSINPCSTGNLAFVGYYCPAVAPLSLFAINTGAVSANVPSVSNTVNFAIDDASLSFTQGAAAYTNLGGGGGSKRFSWGMPFFYGRQIYVGFDKAKSGTYTGPYYAY